MRHIITLTLGIGAAALVTVAFVRFSHRNNDTQEAQVAALKTELEQKTRELGDAQEAQKRSEEQQQQLLRLSKEMGAELAARHEQSPTSSAVNAANGVGPAARDPGAGEQDGSSSDGAKSGFGKMLSTMMQDPDTKALIRQQQRMVIDQLYSPLAKQIGLNSEEAAALKDLLSEQTVKGAEKASTLMAATSATERKKAMDDIKTEQAASEEQLKSLLGDTRFAQYKEYQETAGERAYLNMFKQQIPAENQLNEQQTEQILAIMREEKRSVATTAGQSLSSAGQDGDNMQALMSEEKAGKLFEAQESLNQKVYERASQMLPPEQLDGFARFQTNQLQMLRMSMTMARKMFGSAQSSDAPALGK